MPAADAHLVHSCIKMVVASLLGWVQATRIAVVIRESSLLTGLTSGVHLLGLTLVVGGTIAMSLLLLGVVVADRPVADVAVPVGRGMSIGLIVSVASGLLLFAPRAVPAASNRLFQIKMVLLLVATMFHFVVHRRVARRSDARRLSVKLAGAIGLALWLGVALAGCAFILLE